MKRVPTAAEIREMIRIRQMHPADRPGAIAKQVEAVVKAPVAQAARELKKVAADAKKTVEEINGQVEALRAQMAASAQTLEIRQRMSPQDLRDALNGLFSTYNFSPAEELVQMLKCPEHPFFVADLGMRVSILKDLQAYVMPKLKSTEIKGKVEHNHQITIMRIGDDGKVMSLEKADRPLEIEAQVVPMTEVAAHG